MAVTATEIRPIKIGDRRSAEDRAFRGLTRVAGMTTFLILVLIGVFLVWKSIPAFSPRHLRSSPTPDGRPRELIRSSASLRADRHGHHLGHRTDRGDPVSIACALFINEYTPLKLLGFLPIKNFLTAAVDLMRLCRRSSTGCGASSSCSPT